MKRRTAVRRTATVGAAVAALIMLAPAAARADPYGDGRQWRFISQFPTGWLCGQSGQALVFFSDATDYSCVRDREGHALFVR
ncbi:hypothetical protein [Nonomuraea sp. SBT364]|uniref:hypothetical protein n=1 Tax=Nonomuraea sp. SBT364 TaxID=1580530 RepID=UPI00066DB9C2|nr:hypothetical protein [Nonomuraea sp. SBT364]